MKEINDKYDINIKNMYKNRQKTFKINYKTSKMSSKKKTFAYM